ncbi:amidase signature domain-containing protein [Fusarium circinatum]|uniref:Amidase signature domain-containing protein n=1 Tax=Fusarium circinatum TaxID=48490 RepID=A0A8H5X9T0_FUSCI|nr:amidase signature domain-containing protein [Fusarium circinatum]
MVLSPIEHASPIHKKRPRCLQPNHVFEVDGVQYLTANGPTFVPTSDVPKTPCPVTAITSPGASPLTRDWLEAYLDKLDRCDVYDTKTFIKGLIITSSVCRQTISVECRDFLQQLGNEWVEMRVEDSKDSLAPGPYLYLDGSLKCIFRLYDDVQRAFMCGIEAVSDPRPSSEFQQLRVSGTSYDSLAIAVPSQVPSLVNNSPSQLRVAVKDCYLLQGLRTSLCNRAYYDISDPATFTADVVQKLVEDGAHILGLTKLSSMIAREEPMDAVDYPTAFNPRGDGYHTDTSRSSRRPAMANGVWQYQPSHDDISLRGLIKTYALFDTPCVFARSFDVVKRVANIWGAASYSGAIGQTKRPYRLIYPVDYFPVQSSEQMNLLTSFVDDVERLAPATLVTFSIRDSWKQNHPSDVSNNVDEYLQDVVKGTFYHQFYYSSANFRDRYANRHQCKLPYVIPFVQRRWAQGASISLEEHGEATKRLLIYKDWLHKELFGDDNFESFVILPVANASPVYRDEILKSPEKQSALDQLFLPPILGAPDIVIPIGDVPYLFKITGRTEFLPVVANLVGAPTRDLELLHTVERILRKSGRPKGVLTGPRMFN